MPKTKPQIQPPEPLLLRAEQVAAVLNISRSQVYDLAASGRLPQSFYLNRARLWRLSDLRLWTELGMPSIEDFENIKNERK